MNFVFLLFLFSKFVPCIAKSDLLLAIESSCDDSCISVVSRDFEIIFEKKISQIDLHKHFGGVVPELASRSHLEYLQIILSELRNFVDISRIEGVCSTFAPGLIGGLLTGVMISKGIAQMYGKKLISVHHLEGHLESVNIGKKEHVSYPNLTLLVSGGHCQFILAQGFGSYEILGKTLDDSVGEAFDKIGKMLGFDYPGGPEIERWAKNGANSMEIGKPMGGSDLNFSFSGFKTSVMKFLEKNTNFMQDSGFIADVCKNVQDVISENLAHKTALALKLLEKNGKRVENFVLCGGVAANKQIIAKIAEVCDKFGVILHYPDIKYATDNATMVAFAGVKRLIYGEFSDFSLSPASRMLLSDVNFQKR